MAAWSPDVARDTSFPSPAQVEVTSQGIVRVAPRGHVDEEQALALIEDVQRALRGLPEPVPVLVDARGARGLAGAARRLLHEPLRQGPPSFLAVVGAPLARRLAILAAVHSSLVIRTRFFDREEPALAWLKDVAGAQGLPPAR